MSPLLRLTLLAGLFLPLTALAGIEQALLRFYSAEELTTFSTYLGRSTGHQAQRQGFRTLVPSDPENRSGQYFMLRVDRAVLRQASHARIQWIATDSKEVRLLELALPNPIETPWLYLGLTGKDWPQGAAVEPLAWRIELTDTGGRMIAEWSSFLWEQ